MGLFDLFKKKGLNPAVQFPVSLNGGATVAKFARQTSIEDSYASNADVYAIVALLARKAASIPWYVYRKKTDKGAGLALERYKQASRHPMDMATLKAYRAKSLDDSEVVMDSPLGQILTRPNATQGQDKFFETLYTYYWLTGEGFLWGNNGGIEGDRAPFVELYALPSQNMEHILDPSDIFGVTGWRLNVGGGIRLPKELVMQWKTCNPLVVDDHVGIRGMSPLQAAYRTSLMGNEAEIAAYNMMRNGGAKGALSPEAVNNQVPMVSVEQAQAIRDFMGQYINGGVNKGNISVLQTPWKYLDFGLSSVDMQLIDSQKITLEKLCRVFGVPVVLFSPDNMADNNYQNALRDLVTNTIVPAIASLRDELNRFLMPRNGRGDEYIDFDIQALPELQRDIEKLVTAVANAPFLTFDEKREMCGYEALGGPFAEAYVASGLVPLGEVSLNLGGDLGEANI